MKRILCFFFIVIFFSFLPHFKPVKAQFDLFESKMAGMNCGIPGYKPKINLKDLIRNAEEEDYFKDFKEENECCPKEANVLCPDIENSVLGTITIFLDKVPFIGKALKDLNATCDEMKKVQGQVGDGRCVFGVVDEKTVPNKCYCVDEDLKSDPLAAVQKMCEKYVHNNPAEFKSCMYCASGQFENGETTSKEVFDRGYWTGLGCIPTDFDSFITHFVMKIGIGFAGVVALLCIIFSAIMIQTSAGNAEKVKKAQQNMTSCILGLILIIFSIFILHLIGVDILRIPFLK